MDKFRAPRKRMCKVAGTSRMSSDTKLWAEILRVKVTGSKISGFVLGQKVASSLAATAYHKGTFTAAQLALASL